MTDVVVVVEAETEVEAEAEAERLSKHEDVIQELYVHMLDFPAQRLVDIEEEHRAQDVRVVTDETQRDRLLDKIRVLAIKELIIQRVSEALAIKEANRNLRPIIEGESENRDDNRKGNGGGNGNGNGGGNENGNDGGNGNGNDRGNKNNVYKMTPHHPPVAPKVKAVVVASPAGVLDMIIHSSSKSDHSEDLSLPKHAPIVPFTSPLLF
nr:hypothetical protein [Tanacetum cinerariifolium]